MLFFYFYFFVLFFMLTVFLILQDLKHSQLSVIYSYAKVLKEYESIEWSINRALICNYLCINRASLVAQMVKHMPAMQVRSLCWEDPLEKEMATHSSTLAWKIPWIEEPTGFGVTKTWTRLSHFTQFMYKFAHDVNN